MSDGNRSESLADLKPLTLQPSDPMTNDTDTTPTDSPVTKDPPRAPCYEYQNDHISAEQFFERIDATPNGDLRDLIDRWEEAAQHAKEQGELSEYDGIAGCIDELKAVINDD